MRPFVGIALAEKLHEGKELVMAIVDRKGSENSQVTSPVKGGFVTRRESSGRFVEVQSESGTYRARPKTEVAVNAAASKRHSALKRLADR